MSATKGEGPMGRFIDWIDEILDYADIAEEIRDRLQRLREIQESDDPDPVKGGRLISELLDLVGDHDPTGLLGRLLKEYSEAVDISLDRIEEDVCSKYCELRDQGFSHEQATRLSLLDPDVAAWCRARCIQLPRLAGRPIAPAPGYDGPGQLPPIEDWDLTPEPEYPWTREHHECCSNLSEAERNPTVETSDLRIVEDYPNPNRFMGEIEISHPCGILYDGVDVLIDGVMSIWRYRAPAGLSYVSIRRSGDNTRVTYEFHGVPLSRYNPWVEVSVEASSVCVGAYVNSWTITA